MNTTDFDKAFGTTEWDLCDRLMKVHDAVPNGDKRRWELLTKATDAVLEGRTPDLEMLAAAMGDAARRQLEGMIAAVSGESGVLSHDLAKAAVMKTDLGEMLRDVLERAERAAVAAAPITKQLDASLSKKAEDRRLMDRARQLQVEKAREGRPVSLLQAIDIAKAEG